MLVMPILLSLDRMDAMFGGTRVNSECLSIQAVSCSCGARCDIPASGFLNIALLVSCNHIFNTNISDATVLMVKG